MISMLGIRTAFILQSWETTDPLQADGDVRVLSLGPQTNGSAFHGERNVEGRRVDVVVIFFFLKEEKFIHS